MPSTLSFVTFTITSRVVYISYLGKRVDTNVTWYHQMILHTIILRNNRWYTWYHTFDRPLPPLQYVVFAPKLRDLPPPALDQFDFDNKFANPISRLVQLTNKCSNDDLEYYAQEAITIGGLVESAKTEVDGNHLLYNLFQKVCWWKWLYERCD